MKTRIWFNQWFNNVYYFINLIKNNSDNNEFIVYGSHPKENTIYRNACDYFEVEPPLSGMEYVEYCLDFCRRNQIDVFVPYNNMLLISQNIHRFDQIGTKVLVERNSKLLEVILNKVAFYESCKSTGIYELPEYYIVNTARDFSEAYDKISAKNHRVCIKPVASAGGSGFRVIDNSASTLKNLLGDINHKISYDETVKILSQQEAFEDIMVMEFLEGSEYSIDCLAFKGRLLAAVPRKKVDSRVRALEDVPELVNLAKKTEDVYGISYIFNIQVKYSNGIPKLLEINPRMSGGLNATCFCGINYPYLAIMLLLGKSITVPKPLLNIATTKIENRYILKQN